MTCVDRGCPRPPANPPKNPHMHSSTTNREEAALGLQLPSCICQITTVGGWAVFRLTNRRKKKLGSPEYHLRADVEKNGNFWTPTAWVNVPQQTAFPGQTAWLSRLRQQQPPRSVKSPGTEKLLRQRQWESVMSSDWGKCKELPLSHWAPVKP